MRNVTQGLLLATVAGIMAAAMMTGCAPPTASASGTGAPSAGGGEPPPAPAPTPPAPQETEMSWMLEADHFGDDNATIWAQTSNRSAPFEWDRIAPGAVSVSIGGQPLPITNRAYPPAFADDFFGAEWKLDAEVTAGSVVLVLTAENQRRATDEVGSVTITDGGSGYTSAPTITFTGGDGSGAAATATAADQVASITMTNCGSGYAETFAIRGTPIHAITFTGGGATTAAAATAWALPQTVGGVQIPSGSRGTGYTSAPTVSFTAIIGGSGATGTAVLTGATVTSVTMTNAGCGYRSPPTVTFTGGGATVAAAGTARYGVGITPNRIVITNPGSGYTSAPTVVFPTPLGGSSIGVAVTAVGTAVMTDAVRKIEVTDGGSGYTSAPTVVFTGGGSGVTAATAVAELKLTGNSEFDNLYFARQVLYGKELLIEITGEATGS